MKRSFKLLWGLTRVAVVVLLVLWCVVHLRAFDIYFPVMPPRWARIAGVGLMVAGGVLVLWTGGILSSRGILETPGDRLFPTEFVVSGPFRYLRNPMSLGAVLLFAGLGFYQRSVSILLFSVLLFLFFHFVARYFEEPELEKRFGQSYLAYKRRVGRWIPRGK